MGDDGARPVRVGYARVLTDGQDLTAQRDGLAALGVPADRIYIDHELTGRNRDRPGLREALAAVRAGEELVVTKLDRLARSVPDARAIADELTAKGIKLNLGGAVYDPNDAVGRLLFTVLSMIAEFEADLISARTREGMAVARAKAGSAAAPPSSPQPRRHTWSSSTGPANIPVPSSANFSASAGPPCFERSTAPAGPTSDRIYRSRPTAYERRQAISPRSY